MTQQRTLDASQILSFASVLVTRELKNGAASLAGILTSQTLSNDEKIEKIPGTALAMGFAVQLSEKLREYAVQGPHTMLTLDKLDEMVAASLKETLHQLGQEEDGKTTDNLIALYRREMEKIFTIIADRKKSSALSR